ncbi:MAG: restriction endonuclease [Candidatus Bathyarchaeota archaeon]|nr:restriction endonuclease [Candidatus Bathyarchaeota archaeon]
MNHSTLRQVVKVVLRETQEGPVTQDALKKALTVTNEAFNQAIEGLEEERLITLSGENVELSLEQRLNLAVKAIELGTDFKLVSDSLGWLEFEELVAHVFEVNGYEVSRRFRFQAEGRRWEIDVLATRYPYIVCAECKHWTKGMGNSTARNIVEIHKEKTEVFSRHVGELAKRIKVHRWRDAVIVPITLTLSPTKMSIYRRMPSLNILVLPSFLEEFQGQLERMIYHRVDLPEYKPKPTQTRLR